MEIRVKRVYEKPDEEDGTRVLVDRVWPRGLKKEEVQAEHWEKEIAPSTELRKWFDHDESKWEEFKNRYFEELEDDSESVSRLLDIVREDRLTLLYSARDTEHNQAVALKMYLLDQSSQGNS